MRTVPFFQVDAFTKEIFRGNPAAVCPLDEWIDDASMQAIAAENALSETAFVVARDDGAFDLRWFTPAVEVDLCGHATLATGFVLMTELGHDRAKVTFHTKSGALTVKRNGDAFVLDFPKKSFTEQEVPEALVDALGARPVAMVASTEWLAVFESSEAVRALSPDFGKVRALAPRAVNVTAAGTGADADVDFVSRFFTPKQGIDEDPVTGSAHCLLTPYWAERTGKSVFRARQVSRRGGELTCELAGDRVLLGGHAVLVKTGTMRLPETVRRVPRIAALEGPKVLRR
jgi:PhzF family phenazine biosynthesis protein